MAYALALILFFKMFFLAYPVFGSQDGSFVWWKLNGQSRSPEGGKLISLNLEAQGEPLISNIEVIYRQTPLKRGLKSHLGEGGPFFRKSVSPSQRDFIFYLGQLAKLEVFARARIGANWSYAQTVASGDGKSGLPDPDGSPIDFETISLNWPKWRTIDESVFLRATAGSRFELEFSEVPCLVKVFEDQAVMANFRAKDDRRFFYTKADDYELTHDATRTLKKYLVFTAYLSQGDRASFSTPVIRANNRRLDYPQGFAAMAATVFGVIGLVVASGARFEFR
jgi:hypothetical protein